MATIATQPLIVAKVGLQSRPPPSRQGKPFKSFIEVMKFILILINQEVFDKLRRTTVKKPFSKCQSEPVEDFLVKF